MFRYLALVWNPDTASDCDGAATLRARFRSTSANWRSTLAADGLQVFHAGARAGSSKPCVLHDGSGVVLGTLFHKEANKGTTRKDVLDPQETAQVLASKGRELTASYWGRYVAFLLAPGSRTVWVLRDPRGGLPCFETQHRGVTLFFSSIEDCLNLGLQPPSINWRYIRARVALGPLQSEKTALMQVSEVQPGECVEFASGKESRSLYWHPHSFAISDVMEDPAEAATLMRSVGRSCVHAWASCYESILHRLSGGLDSSVVLGSLKDAPTAPRVTCLNYFHSSSAQSDERIFARIAATRGRCELIEQHRSSEATTFDILRNASLTVNPMRHLAHLETSVWERPLAKERCASAIFTGDGGDSLFCRHEKNFAVSDYLRAHGISSGLFSLAQSVAPLVGLSIWRVLWSAFGDCLTWRDGSATRRVLNFDKLVRRDVLEAAARDDDFLHPWYRSAAELPVGKARHIRHALFAEDIFYVPFAEPDDPEEVHPLRSQPFVELCLRIPTYVHMDGGRDRGLARRAFAQDVPEQILSRCWKGGADAFAKEVLQRNVPFAREFLLDGILVKERLLDRSTLEPTLSGDMSKATAHAMEIFDYLINEAWLQSWTRAARAAAVQDVPGDPGIIGCRRALS